MPLWNSARMASFSCWCLVTTCASSFLYSSRAARCASAIASAIRVWMGIWVDDGSVVAGWWGREGGDPGECRGISIVSASEPVEKRG